MLAGGDEPRRATSIVDAHDENHLRRGLRSRASPLLRQGGPRGSVRRGRGAVLHGRGEVSQLQREPRRGRWALRASALRRLRAATVLALRAHRPRARREGADPSAVRSGPEARPLQEPVLSPRLRARGAACVRRHRAASELRREPRRERGRLRAATALRAAGAAGMHRGCPDPGLRYRSRRGRRRLPARWRAASGDPWRGTGARAEAAGARARSASGRAGAAETEGAAGASPASGPGPEAGGPAAGPARTAAAATLTIRTGRPGW